MRKHLTSTYYALGILGTGGYKDKSEETGKQYFSAMDVEQKYIQVSESFKEVVEQADGFMQEMTYDLSLEG